MKRFLFSLLLSCVLLGNVRANKAVDFVNNYSGYGTILSALTLGGAVISDRLIAKSIDRLEKERRLLDSRSIALEINTDRVKQIKKTLVLLKALQWGLIRPVEVASGIMTLGLCVNKGRVWIKTFGDEFITFGKDDLNFG